MKYHINYIYQKRKMVERYIAAGKGNFILKHIKDCYDEEAAAMILEDLEK